jgi:DNA-directed RNA polymerase specialized sigma24 family protein
MSGRQSVWVGALRGLDWFSVGGDFAGWLARSGRREIFEDVSYFLS